MTDPLVDVFGGFFAETGSGVVAIWDQYDGASGAERVLWSSYTPIYGWSAPAVLTPDFVSDPNDFTYFPRIASDGDGSVSAVFTRFDNSEGYASIHTTRYEAGFGWTPPTQLSALSKHSFQSNIAVNDGGDAIAVWNERDGSGQYDILAAEYTKGVGWGAATVLDVSTYNAAGVAVAINLHGDGVAVWRESTAASTLDLMAARFTPGEGWGAPEHLETLSATVGDSYGVAIDPAGTIMAIWSQADAGLSSVWSNRFTVGAGWGVAEAIDGTDAVASSNPRIALGQDGNALAIWVEQDGARDDVMSSRYVAGAGWGGPVRIDSEDVRSTNSPALTITNEGRGVGGWLLDDASTPTIQTSVFE